MKADDRVILYMIQFSKNLLSILSLRIVINLWTDNETDSNNFVVQCANDTDTVFKTIRIPLKSGRAVYLAQQKQKDCRTAKNK